MVMHKGRLITSKTETTIEKGGVEMAYQPARGVQRSYSRGQPVNISPPRGRSEVSCQPSETRSQQVNQIHPQGSNTPVVSWSQPAGPVLSAREERRMRRDIGSGIN